MRRPTRPCEQSDLVALWHQQRYYSVDKNGRKWSFIRRRQAKLVFSEYVCENCRESYLKWDAASDHLVIRARGGNLLR